MLLVTFALSIILNLTFIMTCLALPVPPKLAADSLSLFEEEKLHYPKTRDALHSLCRNLVSAQRSYELDMYYRINDMQRMVISNIEAVCGKYI